MSKENQISPSLIASAFLERSIFACFMFSIVTVICLNFYSEDWLFLSLTTLPLFVQSLSLDWHLQVEKKYRELIIHETVPRLFASFVLVILLYFNRPELGFLAFALLSILPIGISSIKSYPDKVFTNLSSKVKTGFANSLSSIYFSATLPMVVMLDFFDLKALSFYDRIYKLIMTLLIPFTIAQISRLRSLALGPEIFRWDKCIRIVMGNAVVYFLGAMLALHQSVQQLIFGSSLIRVDYWLLFALLSAFVGANRILAPLSQAILNSPAPLIRSQMSAISVYIVMGAIIFMVTRSSTVAVFLMIACEFASLVTFLLIIKRNIYANY